MPKRYGKSRTQQQRHQGASTSSNAPTASGGPVAPAESTGQVDTESEFSVPPKWQENEQENANASTGPDSAARDGERSEEAADTRAS